MNGDGEGGSVGAYMPAVGGKGHRVGQTTSYQFDDHGYQG